MIVLTYATARKAGAMIDESTPARRHDRTLRLAVNKNDSARLSARVDLESDSVQPVSASEMPDFNSLNLPRKISSFCQNLRWLTNTDES